MSFVCAADAYGIAASGDYAYGLEANTGLYVMWIYQRFLNTKGRTAQSVQINPSSDIVHAVKLSSVPNPSGRIW